MTTATTSEPGTRGGFGIMRAMDDVELTEVGEPLVAACHGSGHEIGA